MCKYFYQLTEHPSIWKRLLNSVDFRLPPLPPTAHYQKVNLSPLEAERLLVRAISWDKSWRRRCPEVFDDWNIDFQYHINSVALIPGGRYLIASASDAARHAHQILVLALDYRHNAVPIAALPVPYKPYNVHAKYMYVKEAPPEDTLLTEELANALPKVPGIVISYVYGKPKSREDRRRYLTLPLIMSFSDRCCSQRPIGIRRRIWQGPSCAICPRMSLRSHPPQ